MFYYLSGTVAEIEANLAVIDCGGVGYACSTTNYTLSQLKRGERARLYTYMNINTNAKDDVVELFGFASQSELKSFRMLINVNGVGPRAALSILSSTTPANLAMSVVMGDEKALTAAPGIGKKIAQRIILELKDKLAKEQSSGGFEAAGITIPAMQQGSKSSEASAALAVLGYGTQDIAAALRGIDMEALPLEEIIRQALKKMVR
ncbi:MAG: Holliday junction branch migration protein RuvA [Ruminococcaceae bacterium]|jgi:Holliday junction DNA helicase RuvA|nr:Holliday junction branch migration protein RuvA [Oscillospiraceae bacterium]